MEAPQVALLSRSEAVATELAEDYSVTRVDGVEELTGEAVAAPDCLVIDADALGTPVPDAVEVAAGQWPSASVVVGGTELDDEGINEALAAGADQFVRGDLVERTAELRCRIERSDASATEPEVGELPQYRTVLETIPDGVFVLDPDGRIVDANDTAAELYNVDPDDFIGRPITDMAMEGRIDHEVLEEFTGIVRELLSEENDVEVGTYEHEAYPTPDDERIYETRITLRPYDEEFRGTIGVVRDVTEERERIEELERAEAIIDALPDLVFAANDEGEFYYWNERSTEALDIPEAYSGDSVPVDAVMSEEAIRKSSEELRAVLSDDYDRTRGTFEYTMHTFDGREIPVRTHFSAMYDDSDDFVGMAGIARDITEQQRRKRRLTVLNRVLRHNLRNDMGKITGYADLIESETDDEDVAEYAAGIDEIATGLSEMAANARRLQEVIRADAPDDATVDLAGIVSDVLEEFAAEHPAVEFEWSVPESCLAEGTEDLELAIREVVENAVVHNDAEDPRVEVGVTERDGEVRVQVRDNGPGIPEQDRKIIGDDEDVTPLQHGSGLGLWVVKWVVDRYDGDIEIVNLAPHGSVVELTLRAP